MKNWICFFSQTGSEIYEVSKKLNIKPTLIITNKKDNSNINKDIYKLKTPIIYLPFKPTLEDYKAIIDRFPSIFGNCIITLHGYLRIIPKEVCDKFEIYNLHPGLITKYDFLKGFNPQEKAYNMKLKSSGVVIHRVIDKVDSGDILKSKEINIENCTLDEIYKKLHDLATVEWVGFLKKVLC